MHRRTLAHSQDLDCIREGKYLLPWDMSPSHRQNTPAFVLRKGFEYLREAYGVMGRKEKGAPTDIWLRSGGDMYPDYYMSTFHYQTDGWMSSSSASVYETATETLFIGRQDAMQRLALLALRDHMERKGLLGQTSESLATWSTRADRSDR